MSDRRMQIRPNEPLTLVELEQLFEAAARDVREARKNGGRIESDLPPELLVALQPSLDALHKLFSGKLDR